MGGNLQNLSFVSCTGQRNAQLGLDIVGFLDQHATYDPSRTSRVVPCICVPDKVDRIDVVINTRTGEDRVVEADAHGHSERGACCPWMSGSIIVAGGRLDGNGEGACRQKQTRKQTSEHVEFRHVVRRGYWEK